MPVIIAYKIIYFQLIYYLLHLRPTNALMIIAEAIARLPMVY